MKIILDSKDKTLVCKSNCNEGHGGRETEKELEQKLIEILQSQGYEYIKIRNERDLKENFRRQLERLNSQRIEGFRFTDSEWACFYRENFEGISNEGVAERNKKIQGNEYRKILNRDDGTQLNINFVDRENPQNNYLQVINQFTDGESKNRYDVSILVNGLPLVHLELKARGVNLRDAFNQINRYQTESFHKLFEFIQIFIISNGTETKYYSNTTRNNPEKNSFLFTSFWAHPDNSIVSDLMDFARTFLCKQVILDVLMKYCVLDKDSNLKVLRPYQIYAIERILEKIRISINHKILGKEAGGYIWHTTGSGKTLTSFKAAQLSQKIPGIRKVLFVVDRKDLDSQTYDEYKRFLGESQEQTIDSTENTKKLEELLNDDERRIIITTIQKLRLLLKNGSLEKRVFEEKIVIIMDECHRSQTFDVHELIKKFKGRSLFGFTGTPLFKKDKDEKGKEQNRNMTSERFGDELHTYKIVDAIQNENVLKFLLDYVDNKDGRLGDYKGNNQAKIKSVVKYILENFEIKTHPNTMGSQTNEYVDQTRFNSILTTESISSAIKYYEEFKEQMKGRKRKLNVAMIYSAYSDHKENEEAKETKRDYESLESLHREKLDEAMEDFCRMFKTKVKGFNDYRDQISTRTKSREIDILIVVNMFLTGFDAPRLNTIWIDKHLEGHNLIQAFSRTNRNFDQSKPHGNIVCFRALKEEVDEAITRFAGDGDVVFIEDFMTRMEKFSVVEDHLIKNFPVKEEIIGESREIDFIENYKQFMKLANSLSCDERFESKRKINNLERQDYKSKYLSLHDKYRNPRKPKAGEAVETPVFTGSFELELLRSDEINIDYIFALLAKYSRMKDEKENILRMVRSNQSLRKEEPLIIDYLDRKDMGEDLSYREHKIERLKENVKKLIDSSGLNPEGTSEFIRKCLENKSIYFGGKGVREKIMPKMNLTIEFKQYNDIWDSVKDKIIEIFELFKNI